MREIVFDTETTGLDPIQGDRMVEIGCIELINRFPSGQTFHCYFNPERDMPEPAFKVHGLSVDFLKDKPLFAHKVEELIEFLGDAPLIAHNAMFDLGFLNAELERAKKAAVARERLVDTLMLARRKHPGGSNRLDDLCARYKIDNSKRVKHGALLDAELLAEVYVELIGARQANLGLAGDRLGAGETRVTAIIVRAASAAARAADRGGGARRPPRVHRDAGRSRDLAEISCRPLEADLGRVANEYFNNHEATAVSFKEGWFYPGDRGRSNENGLLFLTGREREIINRGGVKIDPVNVDEDVLAYPASKMQRRLVSQARWDRQSTHI